MSLKTLRRRMERDPFSALVLADKRSLRELLKRFHGLHHEHLRRMRRIPSMQHATRGCRTCRRIIARRRKEGK
jgi:hypothetical protein